MVNPITAPFTAMLNLATRSFSSIPQFMQVRILHRLFTTLSISINQLAGVWSTRTPTAEEALVAATSLARSVEVDGMSHTSFKRYHSLMRSCRGISKRGGAVVATRTPAASGIRLETGDATG
jgi:hypothetical protein